MGKNKFQGHAPRPTKGELHAAAQQQHKADEAKKEETTEQPQAPEASTAVITPTAEATPAPAAPAPEPQPSAAKVTEAVLYALGKRYAPKTDRNSTTWGKLTKALAEGPKTMPQLAELVKDHKDFLGYMTRGGHIIPHVAAKEQAATTN